MEKFKTAMIAILMLVTIGVLAYMAHKEGCFETITQQETVIQGDPGCPEVFYSKADVFNYQKDLRQQLEEDSIIASLDLETLSNIIDVVLDRDGSISLDALVKEYKVHKQIYDAIGKDQTPPNDVTSKDQTPTAIEQNSEDTPTASPEEHNKDETYMMIDTTISGKKMKVVKKV